jgi:hypothetical protein
MEGGAHQPDKIGTELGNSVLESHVMAIHIVALENNQLLIQEVSLLETLRKSIKATEAEHGSDAEFRYYHHCRTERRQADDIANILSEGDSALETLTCLDVADMQSLVEIELKSRHVVPCGHIYYVDACTRRDIDLGALDQCGAL